MATEVKRSEAPGQEGLIAALTPTPPANVTRVTNDIAPAAIFKIVLTLAGIWFLIHVFPVIILMAISLMLVATFHPLVSRLQGRLGRRWALVGVVTALVLLFLGAFALLIPPLIYQGYHLLQHAPEYIQQLQTLLAKHGIHVNVKQQVEQLSGGTTIGSPHLMILLSSTVAVLTAFATVAILTIYLLIEGPQVATSLMRLLPRRERLHVRRLGIEIGLHVGGYMRGQLITSALAGLFSFTLLLLAGVPGALTLGALAALADAIPLIGLLIALVPAVLMALTVSSTKAIIVAVAYLVYHQLESYVIGPKVYGGALGLSLTVIVVSLLIGAELMGMTGALLALPVAAAIPCILAYIQDWQERHSPVEPETSLP
jgi:predicted PurR-regulated permease PerM